jgi:hypothetical protein
MVGMGAGYRRRFAIVLCALSALAGCGGGGVAAVDAAVERAMTGMCSADIPLGQACNTLVDPGDRVVPTCATETMPTGQGGPIFDGTYVLTAQTFYDVPVCPQSTFSQIIEIVGDCMQIGSGTFGTAAARLTVAGNSLTTTRTCVHVGTDAGISMAGPSTQTFTATATTFTLFTDYTVAGEPGSDNVAVYTKR